MSYDYKEEAKLVEAALYKAFPQFVSANAFDDKASSYTSLGMVGVIHRAYEQLQSELAALKESQAWIPVGERLPEEAEGRHDNATEWTEKLVCNSDGEVWPEWWTYKEHWERLDIVAWMEYPQPLTVPPQTTNE